MESICDIVIDEDDVYEALCCIDPSKSCGPDEIVGRLLKEGTPCRSTPLTKLFNLSLKTSVLPSDWTSAIITPVHKKGSRHDARNYRPISLTSISVKILERLIHRKIMNFLNHHNKLSSHQHGFCTAHSCQTQLLQSVHHWAQSLDKRSSTHIIFLDFSKAFDSVPHERLLIRLDCIGVGGAVLKWIRAFPN